MNFCPLSTHNQISRMPSHMLRVTIGSAMGFCMAQNQKDALVDDTYHIYIDSELKDGSLTYGELRIPSTEGNAEEIFLSTYVCHPSMANNELSGPQLRYILPRTFFLRNGVAITIASSLYRRHWCDYLSQRILARNEKKMCVQDLIFPVLGMTGHTPMLLRAMGKHLQTEPQKIFSRFIIRAIKAILFYSAVRTNDNTMPRGLIFLFVPFVVLNTENIRSIITSRDDMRLISPGGLQGAYEVYSDIINVLEHNHIYQIQCLCEPQLGMRGLYPTVSQKGSSGEIKNMMNFIAYADGSNDLIDISDRIHTSVKKLIPIVEKLIENHLIQCVED